MSSIYAVLTGDVIDSRRLSSVQLKRLFGDVQNLWKEFGLAYPESVVGRLEVFRGDGWQVALAEPVLCVKAAVFLRAAFRAQRGEVKIDSRIGVGVGGVDRIDRKRLRESNGEAFQRSGTALEALGSSAVHWGFDAGNGEMAAGLGAMVFPLMDVLIRRWSQPEAATAAGALLGLTQDKIAAHPLTAKNDDTQPTQQAIHDALKRIAWASHWEPVLHKATEFLKKGLQ